jgi:hypothetical protein
MPSGTMQNSDDLISRAAVVAALRDIVQRAIRSGERNQLSAINVLAGRIERGEFPPAPGPGPELGSAGAGAGGRR